MSAKPNTGLVLLVFSAMLILIFGGISSVGHAAENKSPGEIPPQTHLTPSPTPTSTPTPTPIPTSPSSQVFNLDEIYFLAIGGNGLYCDNWQRVRRNLPANTRRPYVKADQFEDSLRVLCAYGFPSNQDITFDVYAPDGKRVARYTDPATRRNNSNDAREEVFYMSYGLPAGTWTVVARGGSNRVRTTFTHPPRGSAGIDVTHVLNSQVSHPSDPRWLMPHKRGDRVAVYGAGFRSNSTITVVVARPRSNDQFRFRPVIGWNVQTDSRGQFHLQFPIDRSFSDGIYWVFANPRAGRNLDDDGWISDHDFFRVYSPRRVCRSGPLSNLRENDFVHLSAGSPNNVRNRPGLSGRRIGRVYEYQSMRIIDGPRCSDGYTWWKVEVTDVSASNNGLKGWTAEGDRSGYWLLPVR